MLAERKTEPAVCFLTRAFRNVLYVCVGELFLFAFGVCSACKRLFEEARGETEVGRHSLPPLLALAPRPLPPLAPQTRPAGMQLNHQLEAATSEGVILPEIGQCLLFCSLQLWK